MAEQILHFEVLDRAAGDEFTSIVAKDPVLGRTVLIREPRAPLALDEAFIKTFVEEARRLSRAQATNVVIFYDFVLPEQPGGSPLLVLEYIETSLADVLKNEKLSLERAASLLRDVLLGLRAVHDAGFCHSNISPESIRITKDGTAKISDIKTAWSRTGKGTLELVAGRYSPHEAFQAGGNVGPWSDLYSLGCVVYESLLSPSEYMNALCLGEKLVDKDAAVRGAEFRRWHCDLNAKAMPAHVRSPNVPKALSDVVAKLMEKEIARRFRSVDEVLLALEKARTADADDASPKMRRGGTRRTSREELVRRSEPVGRRDVAFLVGVIAFGVTLMVLIVYLS